MATEYTAPSDSNLTSPINLSDVDLTKLDFNDIKSSLKSYLETQSLFTDYDFDGSALSVLLDVLSYNTMYYSFYANMIANEMFLDTSTDPNNVASIAKMLGYTPKSKRCAVAEVEITAPAGGEYDVPIGHKIAEASNVNWFYWGTGFTMGAGTTANIEIYGSKSDNPQLNQQNNTIIGDLDVDTSTLKVYVEEDGINIPYTQTDNIVSGLSGDDRIYFVDLVYDGYYKVTFGDGVFGKSVPSTATTRLQYLRGGNGASDNGLVTFEGVNGLSVSTITSARGGFRGDTIADVKMYAPSFFQSQNRAVTKSDYYSLIVNDLRSISSISVWGGEENNPPRYGRVFVSTTQESDIDIQEIVSTLKEKSIVSIIPEYLDPKINVVYFKNFVVDYDEFATSKTPEELRDLVKVYLTANHTFGLLGDGLSYENINSNITALDTGIVGIGYYLQLTQSSGSASPSGSYLFDFGQELVNQQNVRNEVGQSIYSSRFAHSSYPNDGSVYYIKNGADGQIDIYKYVVDDSDVLLEDSIGTYDYKTGVIYLRDVFASEPFNIYFEPKSLNISSKRNILFHREPGWLNDIEVIKMDAI
jgi:hypothetical protein